MIVERTEYKGQPVLILKRNENDKYPFSFGLSKARLIIEGIEEIKKFVAENDNKTEEKKYFSVLSGPHVNAVRKRTGCRQVL